MATLEDATNNSLTTGNVITTAPTFAGTNRLGVSMAMAGYGTQDTNAETLGGTAEDGEIYSFTGGGDRRCASHYWLNPSTGAQTFSITFAGPGKDELGLIGWALSNVDQSTPVDTAVTGSGTGTADTDQNISSDTDDIILGFLMLSNPTTGVPQTVTPDNAGTLEEDTGAITYFQCTGSYWDGNGSTVQVGHSWSTSVGWSQGFVNVNTAAAADVLQPQIWM